MHSITVTMLHVKFTHTHTNVSRYTFPYHWSQLKGALHIRFYVIYFLSHILCYFIKFFPLHSILSQKYTFIYINACKILVSHCAAVDMCACKRAYNMTCCAHYVFSVFTLLVRHFHFILNISYSNVLRCTSILLIHFFLFFIYYFKFLFLLFCYFPFSSSLSLFYFCRSCFHASLYILLP